MEKIYTGKYFQLAESIIQETRTEHGVGWGAYDRNFMIQLQKDILSTQNVLYQYKFSISDYVVAAGADGNIVVETGKPTMTYSVLWGNEEFQRAHCNDVFDDESEFAFSYGVLDSDFLVGSIENHLIVANIVIINDSSGKFDVGACKDVYTSLEGYLGELFEKRNYVEGTCNYCTRPSYVRAEEEANREAARAELRKAEAHERALNGRPPSNYIGEEAVSLFDGA